MVPKTRGRHGCWMRVCLMLVCLNIRKSKKVWNMNESSCCQNNWESKARLTGANQELGWNFNCMLTYGSPPDCRSFPPIFLRTESQHQTGSLSATTIQKTGSYYLSINPLLTSSIKWHCVGWKQGSHWRDRPPRQPQYSYTSYHVLDFSNKFNNHAYQIGQLIWIS